MKSVQLSPGSRLGCLHLEESFAVLPWGELPFWKPHSSQSLIFFNVFMVRHREVSGTNRGESFARMDLKLFLLLLQPLGFPCFDSLVALMHKGF